MLVCSLESYNFVLSGAGGLFWRGELYSLKAIRQVKGVGDGEEALNEGRAGGFGNDFFVVVLAFLAASEKTPAEMKGALLVPFEDDAEYVFFVEKKLQGECFVVDLIGFSVWEFSDLHGVGNDDPRLCVGFKGNLFHGP